MQTIFNHMGLVTLALAGIEALLVLIVAKVEHDCPELVMVPIR